MSDILTRRASDRHPVLPDIGRPRVAKAEVRIPDMGTWAEQIGRAIARAVEIAHLSNKVAAAKVGVDDAEFGKWLSGARRPHMDRLFAVPELAGPLAVELCKLSRRVTVETVVRLEHTA